MSITTGVSATTEINRYLAFDLGTEAIKKRDGQNFKDVKLQRKNRCVHYLQLTV